MRAMVVDDSRAMRFLLKGMLEKLGFDVAQAGHGTEALERLADADPPAVVLIDWNMPVMNGLELVRAMRANPRYAGTRLVMVTTETEADRMLDALAAGADEYAMKPFTLDVIAAKLEMIGVLAGAAATLRSAV